MQSNDYLITTMRIGSQNERNAAAIELRRRGVDVERLQQDYIPQFQPFEKLPRSRSAHSSSFKSVTKYYPDGTVEITTSLDFDSRYEDF